MEVVQQCFHRFWLVVRELDIRKWLLWTCGQRSFCLVSFTICWVICPWTNADVAGYMDCMEIDKTGSPWTVDSPNRFLLRLMSQSADLYQSYMPLEERFFGQIATKKPRPELYLLGQVSLWEFTENLNVFAYITSKMSKIVILGRNIYFLSANRHLACSLYSVYKDKLHWPLFWTVLCFIIHRIVQTHLSHRHTSISHRSPSGFQISSVVMEIWQLLWSGTICLSNR